MNLLVFQLDGNDYGVPLEVVREVARAVEITPLAGAPRVVEGLIDFRGSVVPVFSLRRRFGLPDRAIQLSDVLVVVERARRLAALHVDAVQWLTEVDDGSVQDAGALVRGGAHVAGVARTADGVILLHDVEAFLSAAEAETLDQALAGHGAAPVP